MPTTVTPFVESPPYREDDDTSDAEMHRFKVQQGLAPPRGGDVYTGEISMFASGDEANDIEDMTVRYSDNVKDDEDDEDKDVY